MAEGIIAAVLAAGAWKGEVPAGTPALRALTPLNGRPMLSYVLDALAGCKAITGVVLVGPHELSDAFPGVERLDAAEQLTGNVLVASRYALGKGRVMLVGSDIPLLSAAGIQDFVDRCADPEVRLFYAIIEKGLVASAYPGMRRTFVRLSDGTYTGGNLLFGSPRFLLDSQHRVQAIYDQRKNVPGLARLMGYPLIARLVLTSVLRLPLLDVASAGRLVGKSLGAKVAGVPVGYPEIGADLDSPDEIPYYEDLLRRRAGG
ncbi:MAG: NTP transferase domain-containing protein [Chloroflexi bacterium]|nr:NTP transferase domain-containing protein [Chloroflexota bacterium]